MDYDHLSLSEQLDKLAREPIDLAKLTYDSIQAARLRMSYDQFHKGTYHYLDYLIIFGYPNESITIHPDPEENIREMQAAFERRKQYMESIKLSLETRHKEYLESGKYQEMIRLGSILGFACNAAA